MRCPCTLWDAEEEKYLLYAVKGIKHREQWTKSKDCAGNGGRRVPNIKRNAGIPLSNANCI